MTNGMTRGDGMNTRTGDDAVVESPSVVPSTVSSDGTAVTAESREKGDRSRTRRNCLIQLIVLLISLSLVAGIALAANLRRREHDGSVVSPSSTVTGHGPDAGPTVTGTIPSHAESYSGSESEKGSSVAERTGATPSSSDWFVRPLAIVHRGDDSAPENSLRAITNAGARGADYSEIDVRLDADGTPVVFHDRKTGRLSADHVDVQVKDLTTRELQHMPMRQHGEDYHVPTLAQAIGAAQQANDHTGLLLDLKTDDRHAPALTDAVMAQVEEAEFADRTMLMSTSDRAVSLIHKRHPDWSVGKCVSPVPGSTIEWPKDSSFVVMRGDRITLGVLARARRDNIPVFAGVSDDYRQGNTTLSLGADGILGGNARKVVNTVARHEIRVDDEGLKHLHGLAAGN